MTGGKAQRADIFVVAGTNGAGKSSIAGGEVAQRRGEYFNPDEAARRYVTNNPGASMRKAYSAVLHRARRRFSEATESGLEYTFETTLGGRRTTDDLIDAAVDGARIRVWYVGLATPEHHIARVRARVERGGHDIPEHVIRARFDSSRKNLIRLIPHLTELQVWDNTADGDPMGDSPIATRLLRLRSGKLRFSVPPEYVPRWARPIAQAAIQSVE